MRDGAERAFLILNYRGADYQQVLNFRRLQIYTINKLL